MRPTRQQVFQVAEAYYETLIAQLSSNQSNYQENLEGNSDSHSLDDRAQADQASEDLRRENDQLIQAQQALAELQRIDHQDDHNQVQAGAVVHTNQGHFLMGVAVPQFLVGEQKFLGISRRAPIYQAMEGKKEGEKFEMRGQTYQIERID